MKSIHIANLLQIFFYGSIGFSIALFAYPPFIRLVQRLKFTQKIRNEDITGGESKLFTALHAHKAGTPTMGGVVIIIAVTLTVLLSRFMAYLGAIPYSILSRGETYLPLFTLVTVGILGMIDDYLNITEKSGQKGLSAKVKMWSLIAFAVLGGLWFTLKLGWSIVHIPGVGDYDIGLWYFPLFVSVIVGTANAVNFTDGLDGLAGGLLLIAYSVFGIIAYFYGLPILAAFCGIVAAAIIAFLWYNVPPASIYMGDAGALALGATLGVIAMLTNAVFILIIVGAIFILETLSIILQLFWKKYFKRKLFLIAPIHHHFEAKGWSETQIVMRFWIFGMIFGVFGLLFGLLGMGRWGMF